VGHTHPPISAHMGGWFPQDPTVFRCSGLPVMLTARMCRCGREVLVALVGLRKASIDGYRTRPDLGPRERTWGRFGDGSVR
jgi:hypothetical protein